MRARDHKTHSDARSRGMQPPCPCGRGESLSDFHFWLPCCTRRAEQDCHGCPPRTSGDGARATPKPRLSQGSGKARRASNLWVIRRRGRQKFRRSYGASSLLKRSPIPASPSLWRGSPRRNPWRRSEGSPEAAVGQESAEQRIGESPRYSTRPSSVISRAW